MLKKILFFCVSIFISLSSNATNSNFNYSYIQLNHAKINEDNKLKENSFNLSKSINNSMFFTSSYSQGEFYLDSTETHSYSIGLGSNIGINEVTDMVFSFQLAKGIEKNRLLEMEIDQDTLNASIEIKHIILNNLEVSGAINYSNFAMIDNGSGHDLSYDFGISWTINESLSLISGVSHNDSNSINIGIEMGL